MSGATNDLLIRKAQEEVGHSLNTLIDAIGSLNFLKYSLKKHMWSDSIDVYSILSDAHVLLNIPLPNGKVGAGGDVNAVEGYFAEVSASDRKLLLEEKNSSEQRRVSIRSSNASTSSPTQDKKQLKSDTTEVVKNCNDTQCYVCSGDDVDHDLVMCHRCTLAFHKNCSRTIGAHTEANWICPYCVYELEGSGNSAACNSIVEIEKFKVLLTDAQDPSEAGSAPLTPCAIDDITVNKVNPNEYMVKLLAKTKCGLEYADTRYGSLNAAFCGAIELENQVCKKRVNPERGCSIHKKGRGNDDSVVARKQLCSYCLDNGSTQMCLFCGCRSCYRKSDPSKMVACMDCSRRTHFACITPAPTNLTEWRCPVCISSKLEIRPVRTDAYSSQGVSTLAKPGGSQTDSQGVVDGRSDMLSAAGNRHETPLSHIPSKPPRKSVSSRNSFPSDSIVNTMNGIASTVDIPMGVILNDQWVLDLIAKKKFDGSAAGIIAAHCDEKIISKTEEKSVTKVETIPLVEPALSEYNDKPTETGNNSCTISEETLESFEKNENNENSPFSGIEVECLKQFRENYVHGSEINRILKALEVKKQELIKILPSDVVATLISNSEAAAAALAKTRMTASATVGIHTNSNSVSNPNHSVGPNKPSNDRAHSNNYSNSRNISKNSTSSQGNGNTMQGNSTFHSNNNYGNRSQVNQGHHGGNVSKGGYTNYNGQNQRNMNYHMGSNAGHAQYGGQSAGNNNFVFGRGVLSPNMNQLHMQHSTQQMQQQQMLLPPPPGSKSNSQISSPPLASLPGANPNSIINYGSSSNAHRVKGNAHYAQIQQQQMLQRNSNNGHPSNGYNTGSNVNQINYRQSGMNNAVNNNQGSSSNFTYNANFPGGPGQNSGLLLQQRNQQNSTSQMHSVQVVNIHSNNPGNAALSTNNQYNSSFNANTSIASRDGNNSLNHGNNNVARSNNVSQTGPVTGSGVVSARIGAPSVAHLTKASKPGVSAQTNPITNYFEVGSDTLTTGVDGSITEGKGKAVVENVNIDAVK